MPINFDEYIDTAIKDVDYIYKLEESVYKYKEKFITPKSKDIDLKLIYELSSTINRDLIVFNLSQILLDLHIAQQIERSIFEFAIVYVLNHNYDLHFIIPIYNDKYNEIKSNISGEDGNLTLKPALLYGTIAPQDVAFLPVQELFPERWAKLVRRQQVREIKESNMATTDMYKCAKCGERKCRVMQFQARSADEGYCVLVSCLVCFKSFKIA